MHKGQGIRARRLSSEAGRSGDRPGGRAAGQSVGLGGQGDSSVELGLGLGCSTNIIMSLTIDDQLRQLASTVLYNLFSSGAVATPINSLTLLARVITAKPKSLVPGSARFKLTDLNKFNAILDGFSQDWEHGTISVAKDSSETVVVDVRLGVLPPPPATRKRKRIKDEEADSASNSDAEDSKEATPPRTRPSTVLGDLSKELREVYAILQKSTAKGRLLAEQASHQLFTPKPSS
jgi:mRNA m6A methyltransferase catalytic subunit